MTLTALTTLFAIAILFCFAPSHAVELKGPFAYARYPPWNGCTNASFSFDFKTTQTGKVLLWYADDKGGTDFFYVSLVNGTVRLLMNLVSDEDTRTEIILGKGLNDGKWHSVYYERRRALSTLKVDNDTDTKASIGNDFDFGTGNYSDVWIGGLPRECVKDIRSYSLPNVCWDTQFVGSIRNVIYNNCTCQSTRVKLIDGSSIETVPPEICDVRNPCGPGCVCISVDKPEPECDCSRMICVAGAVTHYHLSMDGIKDNLLFNKDGLEAVVSGTPVFGKGVNNTAMLVDSERSITVSGPGHRFECMGDLTRCHHGYTVALWFNISHPVGEKEYVYMSNGGHSDENHGIAMSYAKGYLKFLFKSKAGREWVAGVYNVLPGSWYHVAATWEQSKQLDLYLDGVLMDSSITSRHISPKNDTRYNNFVIGRPNDASVVAERNKMWVDEFDFWSAVRDEFQIRETGPLYSIKMPMDREDGKDVKGGEIRILGNANMVPGVINNALSLDGYTSVDGCDQRKSCIGNFSLCLYGMTVSMWVNFKTIDNGAYILSTGNEGVRLYIKGLQLIAEAEQGNKIWHTTWPKTPSTNRWYFIEATWDQSRLRLYVDQNLVSQSESYQDRPVLHGGDGHLYIGSPGTDHPEGHKAKILVDNVELWYGDRDRLIDLKFILRGRPQRYYIPFDQSKDSKVPHRDLNIDITGPSSILRGKVRGALKLERSSVSLGSHQDTCLGNIDLCRHGLLLSTWIKPVSIESGMDIFSTGSNGIKVRFIENGQMRVVARTTTQEWSVTTDKIIPNVWQFVEIDWDRRTGLRLFVDQQLVESNNNSQSRLRLDDNNPDRYRFYIGRGDGTQAGSRLGTFRIDDFNYWYASRDYLRIFNYIQTGLPERLQMNMDPMEKGMIGDSRLDVVARSGPSRVVGKVNHAVRLDGNLQYLDAGNLEDCFGDLSNCPNGYTGSFFLNISNHKNGTYYFSNGGGLSVYEKDGKMFVSADSGRQLWEVSFPNLEKNVWHFIEYTWHPETGLEVYVGNKLVGWQVEPQEMSHPRSPKGKFLVGYANARDTPLHYANSADATIDELESWQSHRDYLIAFDYILRGNIKPFSFPMERMKNNKILHPYADIIMHNGNQLVEGKVGNALKIGDGLHVTLGDQQSFCTGDLTKCTHGLTIGFFYKPAEKPQQDGYILSSGGYSFLYRDGKYIARFQLEDKLWEASTDQIRPDEWQKVELSWDKRRGVQIYVDGTQVASSPPPTTTTPRRRVDHMVYLGRPSDDIRDGQYGSGSVDELEFWFANRDHLQAFDFIRDDIKYLKVDMDEIRGDRLVNPIRTIYVHGRPTTTQGIHRNAVNLDGRQQYIDVGKNAICDGNPNNCPRGFTTRVKIMPHQLQDDTYFISSPYVNLYQQGGQLVGEVRTQNRVWKTYFDSFTNDIWNQIDLSWHPSEGLAMFVNNKRVEDNLIGQEILEEFNESRPLYVGRADTNMIKENYANVAVDDLELYEAKRDWLIPGLVNPDEDQRLIWMQTTKGPTSTPYPPTPGGKKWLWFDGRSFIHFEGSDLYQNFDSTNETLRIRFQTNKPDGLLWFVNGSGNTGHLSIKDGLLYFITNQTVGGRNVHNTFKISDQRLNDGRWHDVHVNLDGGKIMVILDGQKYEQWTESNFRLISSGGVLLGGSQSPNRNTHGFVKNSFNGKISDVTVNGNNLPGEVDIIRYYLSNQHSQKIIVSGNVTTTDARPDADGSTHPAPSDGGVTFTQSSYLEVPSRRDTHSLEFDFKTTHPNGVLLSARGGSDNFSVELYDGKLYTNLGPSKYLFDTSSVRLNNFQPHNVKISLVDGQTMSLKLDGHERMHTLTVPQRNFNFGDFLLVGGIDQSSHLPWNLWSRDSNLYYKGCIWNLKINSGEAIGLDSMSRAADSSLGIFPGCYTVDLECTKSPCKEGSCYNMWHDYMCDCSQTGFHGKQCEKVSPTAIFNGNEHISIVHRPSKQTYVNDISMRFKTRKSDGWLMSTSNTHNADFLRFFLENGKGKVETNLGGQTKVITIDCKNLVDNEWHTFHVKRKGSFLEATVDKCPSNSIELPGSGYTLDIDRYYIGSRGPGDQPSFVGSLQNIFIDNTDVLVDMNTEVAGTSFTSNAKISTSQTEDSIDFPSTFREHKDSYLQLPPLKSIHGSPLSLLFKTSDPNGLILYNGPSSSSTSRDYFALEIVNGSIVAVVNDNRVIFKGDFADGRWHLLELKPDPSIQNKLELTLDGSKKMAVLELMKSYSELYGDLYVGGVPDEVVVPRAVASKDKGYTGCMASFSLNEKMYNLMEDSKRPTHYVTTGCTDTKTFCSSNVCQHFGVCTETSDTFHCDCNMTSFTGPYCATESEGYQLGLQRKGAVAVHRIIQPARTSKDELAFGFMTWMANGTLVRVDGDRSSDFIEAKLRDGHVEVVYDVGDGIKRVTESRKEFNDGDYHYVTFRRHGGSAVLRVDDLSTQELSVAGTETSTFDNMNIVKIGGNLGPGHKIENPFFGIIAGVFLNSHRFIDDYASGRKKLQEGDIVIASHPFMVAKPVPGEKPIIEDKADGGYGGGVGWSEGTMITGQDGGGGGGIPQTAAVFSAPVVGDSGSGPRAAAVAGAMLGTLLAVSSIMWASYKAKPGWFGSSSSGVLKISSPTNAYQPVGSKETDGLTSFGSAGGQHGTGYSFESANVVKSTSTFTNAQYDAGAAGDTKVISSVHSTTGQGARGGGVEFSGTINRANQTDFSDFNFGTGTAGASNIYDTTFSGMSGSRTMPGNQGYSFEDGLSYSAANQRQLSPPPIILSDGGQYQMRNMALDYSNYNQQNTFSQQQFIPQQPQLLQQQQQQHQQTFQQNYTMGTTGTSPMQAPNLMSSEEIRVDCVQLTTNGRYVVTGSIHGPPQVWDMKSGELIRIMHGDDFSSTDLHLANGDTLLIGQVADQSISPMTVRGHPSSALPPGSYRKLQIWDFSTGKPMEMRNNEFCTASCLMNDGDRMVLGRTEKMGRGTTVVIWDILGNEPIRTISWPGFVGSYDDPLSFIALSKDNRYILAGTQNSSDGSANYVMFDLTVTDFDRLPPNVVSFDAQVDVTTVLENQEAVTGTRHGELIIWSLRTGRALRQLITSSGSSSNVVESAHRGEVTCVCLSKDSQFLVSSSADGTLKIWNMENERLLRTLVGHRDEVWCCTISNDNELVVSGSRDHTIRLWRVEDGGMMASIQTGIDIFRVLLSNNKKTVVALADKFGSRKLIMLQVVRTKVKSTSGSRATSPMGTFTMDSGYRY